MNGMQELILRLVASLGHCYSFDRVLLFKNWIISLLEQVLTLVGPACSLM